MLGPDLHPRPQLRRDSYLCLDGRWEFAHDDADTGLEAGWSRGDTPLAQQIEVPFCPESEASGIGDTGFHPVLWYRRSIRLDEVEPGSTVLLHLGAVDHSCRVWLDGELVAEHRGGMTPVTADLTGVVRPGQQHRLVVRVEDDPTDAAQPRGKQDWRTTTHGIFYDRTSGIWQTVWLEVAPRHHVTELHWTPDLPRECVRAELAFSRTLPAGSRLRVALRHGEEQLAEQTIAVGGQRADLTLHLPALANAMARQRLLWSPEQPELVEAEVELLVPGAEPDRVGSYLGLRSVEVADGRLLLNGRPYFLRMVLEQGYWPESHLTAPSPEARRREVEAIKELGFNGARIHQKVEDPRFLYWCDRLGLVVWGEMANAFVYRPDAAEQLTREWLEVVRRDRSHPCIVTWVPLNESWGVPHIRTRPDQAHFATALYHLTKALDPTRPVISNDGWEHTESDIWSVHDYSPDPDSLRARYGSPEAIRRTLGDRGPGRHRVLLGDATGEQRPVMVTEMGGLSWAPAAGERWFGYATIDSAEELLAGVAGLVAALVDSPEVAGFCWTQLTDTAQESNGLLRADRSPKVAPDQLREAITRPSAAIPAEVVDGYRRRAHRASTAAGQGDPPGTTEPGS
ncbi:glycoside hydrolase family 2 protein [Auraticoccus monumenti]|uniref:Glycosyl hydrolases family 2, TIM barrel domain n=1 Tax=Auraticoccus monumenti TaxID=675864 RepID=A0A1G6TGU6_9ACTN|nr:sugar-binding domain-containing protein [Auraticoccus monumenti]SDD27736.1 Glycosyl hydrolases family 2, TIM barrel domain [Auraticoccus monumenti]